MRSIPIFITHYVTKDSTDLNDVLVEEIRYLEYVTRHPHTTTVVYYDEGGAADELYDVLPSSINLVRNDRAGRNDIQPSLRNKVLDLVDNDSLLVLLHNDVRVTVRWLDNLVSDMLDAEDIYGNGNVVISPRFIPYHYIGSDGSRSENGNFKRKYPEIWNRIERDLFSTDHMRDWCNRWGFDFDGVSVHSPSSSYLTDDGHQLMMYGGTKKFFQDIGPCDENFIGKNYDDQDWGIRALLEGKKNLKSQGCLIGHIEGLSFLHPKVKNIISNDKIFVQKWGQNLFDEMQTGQLWLRLHKEQQK